MIELERTFLLKRIPKGMLDRGRPSEITDIYFPGDAAHPVLRLRKAGDRHELTKKEPIEAGDKSEQEEQTIILTAEEYHALSALPGKVLRKVRHVCTWNGRRVEIDVYKGLLEGIMLADFEFSSRDRIRRS